ncbi:MAG: hypothetical protein ACE5GT_09190 [Rhodospirillales bacterium]
MARRKSPKRKNGDGAEALMRLLFERMEAQPTAEALNENVIIPFAAALEEVCAARGYALNIFGERSNIVVSGAEADSEAIYKLVEEYLSARDGGGDG